MSALEKDFDYGYAVQRVRLDVLDVIDGRRQPALRNGGNPLPHFFSRHAVIGPDDADYGDLDFGEDIDRRASQHEWRCQQNQQGHYNECVRAS